MTYEYDLFVIGAGSGGVRAARIAAGYGARVAVAEDSRVGGTCVIRGCVPKKLFVYAGRFGDALHDAAGFGWSVPPASFSWEIFKTKRDAEIARLEGLYNNTLNNNKVEVIRERASISGPHEVILASGRTVSAGKILIATGGTPARLPVEGAQHAIVSDDIFDMPHQPASIVVVGGGFIALEFASLLAQLGSVVHLIHRGEKLLSGFDEDLRDCALEALKGRGVNVFLQENIAKIERDGSQKRVTLQSGSVISTDCVFMATGRTPNVQSLGLEAVGVALGKAGEILVNAQSQTNIPSIFAVGDVTNRVNLTPVAIREGHAFADTQFGNLPRSVDHSLVAKAVFTTPEIGTVGLSEQEAIAQGVDVKLFTTRFRPMVNTLSGRADRVFMKLVTDAKTTRVLGCHICGPEAGELIQLVAIAIQMKATKADFDATIAVHPTMAEELVTLR